MAALRVESPDPSHMTATHKKSPASQAKAKWKGGCRRVCGRRRGRTRGALPTRPACNLEQQLVILQRDHLQPVELILFQNFSIIRIFMLGSSIPY